MRSSSTTSHQAEFVKPTQVHVYLIATPTIEEAYLAKERLARGDKFEVVANEMSKHPSANKGGDLGWVTAADLPDNVVAEAILAMEPASSATPCAPATSTTSRWSRSKVQPDVAGGGAAQIVAKLQARRAVAREDYMDYLARRADIAVNWAPGEAPWRPNTRPCASSASWWTASRYRWSRLRRGCLTARSSSRPNRCCRPSAPG